MTPFANPSDAVLYEYEEFPKPEVSKFNFSDLGRDIPHEGSDSSHRFVDFFNQKDQPQEKIISVQSAILQDFKDVLATSQD